MERSRSNAWMEVLATVIFVLGFTALVLPYVQGETDRESLQPTPAATVTPDGDRDAELISARPSAEQDDQSDAQAETGADGDDGGAHSEDGHSADEPAAVGTLPDSRPSRQMNSEPAGRANPAPPRAPSLTAPPPPAAAPAVDAASAPRIPSELTAARAQYLLGLLPAVDAHDGAAIAEEEIREACATAIATLREGLRERSVDTIRRALTLLQWVEATAPEFAPGHFCRGVAFYALGDYGEAQASFIKAVEMDESLWERCPLLWYEDFEGAEFRVSTSFREEWITPSDGMLRIQRPEGSPPVAAGVWSVFLLRRPIRDLRAEVHFRFTGSSDEGFVMLNTHILGDRDDRDTLQLRASADGSHLLTHLKYRGGTRSNTVVMETSAPVTTNRWYRLTSEVRGGEIRVYRDGTLLMTNEGNRMSHRMFTEGGQINVSAQMPAPATCDIARIIVTRPHP